MFYCRTMGWEHSERTRVSGNFEKVLGKDTARTWRQRSKKFKQIFKMIWLVFFLHLTLVKVGFLQKTPFCK